MSLYGLVGIVVLVPITYFLWRFIFRGDAIVLIDKSPGKKVSATLKQVIPNGAIVVGVDSNSKQNQITEISVKREIAAKLGLSAPGGFTESPVPLTEKDKLDKETVEFVENYNTENVRWIGKLPLAPDAITEITFPATSTSNLGGNIRFRYEAKIGYGGSMAFCVAKLDSGMPT